jgi:hypothetical protein
LFVRCTATLSCTSKYHRLFGKIIRFDSPTFQTAAIQEYLQKAKSGDPHFIRENGWSDNMLDRTTGGGIFPACYNCRKANVDWLKEQDQQQEYQPHVVILFDICANWTLSLSTRERE